MEGDMVDLSTLPTPQVIEELDYEAIVARQKQTFQDLWEAVRLANPDLGLPDYDVEMLETDPAMIIIQENAYREMLERSTMRVEQICLVIPPKATSTTSRQTTA
jgi:phage-related baseplate assembly protein